MSFPKYSPGFLLLLILLLASQTGLAQRSVNTITLHNAEPELLVRAIKPQLSNGSSVNQYRNQLVINATPAEMASIRQLVKQLDGSGRQLVFSLRREGNLLGDSTTAALESSIGNNNVRISTGPGGIRNETRTIVTIERRGFSGGSNAGQGIRATEGSPAYIATGSSVLIREYKTHPDGQISQLSQPTDISSGFYATAWIDQDIVTVDIDQRDNQYQQGHITTQQLQSRVSGKLGAWIPIGVVMQARQLQASTINTHESADSGSVTRLFLKIDPVD